MRKASSPRSFTLTVRSIPTDTTPTVIKSLKRVDPDRGGTISPMDPINPRRASTRKTPFPALSSLLTRPQSRNSESHPWEFKSPRVHLIIKRRNPGHDRAASHGFCSCQNSPRHTSYRLGQRKAWPEGDHRARPGSVSAPTPPAKPIRPCWKKLTGEVLNRFACLARAFVFPADSPRQT